MSKYLSFIVFTLFLVLPFPSFAGHFDVPLTDEASPAQFSFIDLRERETFVQVTNTDSINRTVHVQIFNVDQNCNENNFFDVYTPNDTHVYNMRDILTNDGNPSGVVLPEGAYGFVVISVVDSDLKMTDEFPGDYVLIGNFRILDDNGYEYRTNSAGLNNRREQPDNDYRFNFSATNGVTLSDVIIITVDIENGEYVAGPLEAHWALDVDIFDVNENPLSCRDVVFSCVDEDNPLLEELLANEVGGSSSASVAAFEYGINEAIPHSRGGELLCPGNVITEGWVFLDEDTNDGDNRAQFIGLNNGNGRGSMDSMWRPACEIRGDDDDESADDDDSIPLCSD